MVPGHPGPPGGGAWCAHVRLGHVEHVGGFDGDDFRLAIATHHRGDDRDALLTLLDHATGFQPGVISVHVWGVGRIASDLNRVSEPASPLIHGSAVSAPTSSAV